MNKRNISTIFLISLALIAPTASVFARGGGGHGGGYHHGGYGYGGGWMAPALVGGALTGAALAASNEPRTVVVQQSADDTNQIRNLQRENRDLRKQIDRQERQIRRLERKLGIAA